MTQEIQMIVLESALQLTDKSQIRDQIEVRKSLLQQMVGSLYTAVVKDEIGKLLLLL